MEAKHVKTVLRGQSSPLPLTKHTRYVVVKTIIKILTASMWLLFYIVTYCGVYLNCWHYKLDAWYYYNRYTCSSQYYLLSLLATKFIHAAGKTLLHHPLVTAESLPWGTADADAVLSFEWVQYWAVAMVNWNICMSHLGEKECSKLLGYDWVTWALYGQCFTVAWCGSLL